MKVFNSQEFIDRLKYMESQPSIYYSVAGGAWSAWNGRAWNLDCVVSIKSILWGWNADKHAPHGGAIYGSNGVADFTPDGGLNYCSDVSQDFSKLIPGEYLCMKDNGYGHAGIYLGDGKVFDVTTAWGVNGATISEIDSYGNRYKNGVRCLKWTYHGKLDYIEYIEESNNMKYKVGDVVKINGVYVSSNSSEKLNPAINKGTITKIVDGARNPYLLDDGNIGWVNDECIIDETPVDYEKLYNEELEKNKILEEKINKAIKDLS